MAGKASASFVRISASKARQVINLVRGRKVSESMEMLKHMNKKAATPVYKLLQAEEETVERVRVYASSGELRTIEERRPWLDDIRRMGVDAIKLRVKDPERRDDIRILREVRAELGDDFIIGVDANQGWPVSLIEPTPIWDLEYERLRILTPGVLDESPSFAPNGSMILYATREGTRGVLSAVSADGNVRQRLILSEGDVREPAWSPVIR